MPESTPLHTLLNTLPQTGRVEWIGVRPARDQAMLILDRVMVSPGKGVAGDRFSGRETSKRQVTLIQHENLSVIASCLHRESIGPEVFRRNLVVSGLNLLALKDKTFRIGDVVLEYTGANRDIQRCSFLSCLDTESEKSLSGEWYKGPRAESWCIWT